MGVYSHVYVYAYAHTHWFIFKKAPRGFTHANLKGEWLSSPGLRHVAGASTSASPSPRSPGNYKQNARTVFNNCLPFSTSKKQYI